MPFIRAHILQQADMGDTCIVNKDIQTTEANRQLIKQSDTFLPAAEIADEWMAGNTEGSDFIANREKLLLAMNTSDDTVIAMGSKSEGDGSSDATGCAGDECNWIFHKGTSLELRLALFKPPIMWFSSEFTKQARFSESSPYRVRMESTAAFSFESFSERSGWKRSYCS